MNDRLDSPSLYMTWSEAPWDQAVCGFPVLQITDMEVKGASASEDILLFEAERDRRGTGLVSCRLPHDRLHESMLLEDRGFRFIEMVYRPELELSRAGNRFGPEGLDVSLAADDDMPTLLSIAGQAFRNERFRMDPRLNPAISDLRYQNWVAGGRRHARQQLHVIRDAARIVSFFIVELLADGTCYWHLNALAPDAQGQGYGRRVWSCMIDLAQRMGARQVCSSIVARNVRVLGLYASLGFRYAPPSMTFHWIRPTP